MKKILSDFISFKKQNFGFIIFQSLFLFIGIYLFILTHEFFVDLLESIALQIYSILAENQQITFNSILPQILEIFAIMIIWICSLFIVYFIFQFFIWKSIGKKFKKDFKSKKIRRFVMKNASYFLLGGTLILLYFVGSILLLVLFKRNVFDTKYGIAYRFLRTILFVIVFHLISQSHVNVLLNKKFKFKKEIKRSLEFSRLKIIGIFLLFIFIFDFILKLLKYILPQNGIYFLIYLVGAGTFISCIILDYYIISVFEKT